MFRREFLKSTAAGAIASSLVSQHAFSQTPAHHDHPPGCGPTYASPAEAMKSPESVPEIWTLLTVRSDWPTFTARIRCSVVAPRLTSLVPKSIAPGETLMSGGGVGVGDGVGVGADEFDV